MALLKCPDCGKEISDAAPSCIGCGRPMLTIHKPQVLTLSSPVQEEAVAPQSSVQEEVVLSELEGDRLYTLTEEKKQKSKKPYSWKSFFLAFFITFILQAIVAGATGGKPKGFHWTLAWIYLTVESWKYWSWKALIPYPAYVVCTSIVGGVVGETGGDRMNARLVMAGMNVVGFTLFAIAFYLRSKKERERVFQ